FISFGTNDMIQYLYKLSRSNSQHAQRDEFRLIMPFIVMVMTRISLKAKVTICGDLASRKDFWPVWAWWKSIGIDVTLSMPAPLIEDFRSSAAIMADA